MSNEALAISSVSKTFRTGVFKKKTAVDNLSFSVPTGQIVGLLGPNGSGKSTTIKMIMGFLKPSSGEILIDGRELSEQTARKEIGYLPENPRFQRFLTAREILTYYGQLFGITQPVLKARIEELLAKVHLQHAADERIQGFSKGMVQRLAIAQALINQPKILIFDEPMSGLDPVGRIEIRKLILQIHSEMANTTIFFSTHILNDVEQICSSVILLKRGQLKRHCNVSALLEGEAQKYEVFLQNVPDAFLQKLKKDPRVHITPSGIALMIEGIEELLVRLNEIRASGAEVAGLLSRRKNLEEALFTDQDTSFLKEPIERGTGT